MKRNNLILLVMLLMGGLFVLAIFLFRQQQDNTPAAAEEKPVPMEDLVKPYNPSLGNPNAKVTVVEFLDPECGTCAALSPMVKGLIHDYEDRVHFVVRYMLYHHNSKQAALAIEAARKQDKYWEMLAQLFFRREWAEQDTPQDAFFEKVAKDLGLDVAKLRADMKDPQILANILADFQQGPSLGVTGTPTFFVNGKIVQSLEYEELKKAIDQALAR
jgi:protein-disulfide isomerase